MMKRFFSKIIYDPIYGRVVYDLVSCLGMTIIVLILFRVFNQESLPLFVIPTIPILVGSSFWIFGVYTRYRTVGSIPKLIIIFSAVAAIGVFYYLFSTLTLALIILLLLVALTTSLPRFFLNFHTTTSFGELLSTNEDTGSILVVGGGGYIGTQVVELLLQKKYKVKVIDKFMYSKAVFNGMAGKERLELVTGDMSDIYSLTLALKNTTAVIHLAGIVGDPAAALHQDLTRHVNITSTRILKEAAKAFGVQRFIFASSCSVYGSNEEVVNEESSLHPVSLYAQTKIDSEKELLEDTFDYFHPTVLRFATVFGHSRKPRFDLVANLFVAQAYTNKKITVANPDQWRPFIHVSDVARAVVLTLESPLKKVSRQVFNVGDDSLNITIGDLAQLVQKISTKKITITTNAVSTDKRNYHVSFKKIKATLGFTSKISLSKGLSEIYFHFQKKTYKRKFTNEYYSNYEMTKLFLHEFESEKYKKTHVFDIS